LRYSVSEKTPLDTARSLRVSCDERAELYGKYRLIIARAVANKKYFWSVQSINFPQKRLVKLPWPPISFPAGVQGALAQSRPRQR
jgi:hypothetical protein